MRGNEEGTGSNAKCDENAPAQRDNIRDNTSTNIPEPYGVDGYQRKYKAGVRTARRDPILAMY